MRHLAFRKQFVEPIRKQHKTSTLRARFRGDVGDVVQAKCEWGKPPFAHLRIRSIDLVRVEDITDAMARRDGFDSAASLRAWLERHYPFVELFTLVTFSTVPKPRNH